MSEMIDRVAQTILNNVGNLDPSMSDRAVQELMRKAARAAIEAMRNAPDEHSTPAILVAGKKALYSCSSDPELEDARGCWQAMIDEALK